MDISALNTPYTAPGSFVARATSSSIFPKYTNHTRALTSRPLLYYSTDAASSFETALHDALWVCGAEALLPVVSASALTQRLLARAHYACPRSGMVHGLRAALRAWARSLGLARVARAEGLATQDAMRSGFHGHGERMREMFAQIDPRAPVGAAMASVRALAVRVMDMIHDMRIEAEVDAGMFISYDHAFPRPPPQA